MAEVYAPEGVMVHWGQSDYVQESQGDWLVRGATYRLSGWRWVTRRGTLLVEGRAQVLSQLVHGQLREPSPCNWASIYLFCMNHHSYHSS